MRTSSMRRLALLAAAAVFLFHLAANPHYGFFRDELYFIVCGRHPQFGYVDQPPLIPLLAAASQAFGTSLVALRAVSALFGAASVYVTVLLAEELGGGRFAAGLAAIVAALSPEIAVFGVLVGPDCATIVAWPLLALLVLRLAKGADPRLWLAAGAVAGLALEAKYSASFFIVALLLGLIVTRDGRAAFSGWVFAGGGLALLLALPSALWQAANGFPMMEVLAAGQKGKNVVLGPLAYLGQQILITNPLLAPIWMAGFAWCFLRARWLGVASAVTLFMVIALHGKDYYACGIFPGLFAAGAVAIEAWLPGRLRASTMVVALCAGALTFPMVAPVLPEEAFVRYQTALHLRPTPSEHHQQTALPQHFADMHGWPELVATMERVVAKLTPEERARAVIFTPNYGDASAINFLGQGRLPRAISGHNQYFLWGPQGDGSVLINLAGGCGKDRGIYLSVEDAGRFTAPWIMPYEDGVPIRICRRLQKPIAEVWPQLKHYN